MENKGTVIALDVSKKGIGLLKENCKRLSIDIVKSYLMDAVTMSADRQGDLGEIGRDGFDKILIDARVQALVF